MARIITTHDINTNKGKIEYLLGEIDGKYHKLNQKKELEATLFELHFYIRNARRGLFGFAFYSEIAEKIADSPACGRFIRLSIRALNKL